MKKTTFIFSLCLLQFSYAQISDFNHINFTIADNTAKLHQNESLENLPLLSHKLTSKLSTDVEKFRAIYSWVCNNIKGDYRQHSKVSKMRKKYKNDSINLIKWNEKYKKYAFKKLLKHKKTMCTGYAYLIKELAYLAGIECEIVNGYGRTVESNVEKLELTDHSWNAVKLNNKWYLCDATWSSGYMDYNNSFINDYNPGYFLTDPVLFAKNHFPIKKKWLLTSLETEKTFVSAPIIYNKTFKHKVLPTYPLNMNFEVKKNEDVGFQIKKLNNNSFDKITLVHFLKNDEKSFPITDIIDQNGKIEFKSKFKWLGYYDVHVKINEDIVATYTIKVSKN